MKIITCASYYGCGSSAVTDLFSEYKGVKSLGDYEFRFLHDIDGVSDLEFHLTECPNRHNSGHALKRFEKLSKFNAGRSYNIRYEKYFHDQYMSITREYIEKLIMYKYTGHWFYDYYDHRSTKGYYAIQLMNKILAWLSFIRWRPLQNEQTYGTITDNQKFIEYTQEYTHKLLKSANESNAPYLMIDQLMPASNIDRCLRYVKDDVFVFVVDRDPRDLYIMGKYVWVNEHVMPSGDPDTFCKWIRFTRGCSENQEYDRNCVLKMRFEDLIYRYEESKHKLISIVGLKEADHVDIFGHFNPKRSVVNTQSWLNYPKEAEAIHRIEELLPEYIYDFDSVKDVEIKGVECCDKHNF